MHRFFVNIKHGNYFILEENVLKHIKVARLENSEFLCNYKSRFYKCILEKNKAKIIEELNIDNEYKKPIILAAPIIKIKRFEMILQKATELGASKIIPFYSKFTDIKLLKYDFKNKINRFREIIKNAAEQSFRNIIPSLEEISNFENLTLNKDVKNIYLAYENADKKLQDNLLKPNSLFIIGPEGGFSLDEIDLAIKNNVKVISLGKTILRAETACFKVLSLVKE